MRRMALLLAYWWKRLKQVVENHVPLRKHSRLLLDEDKVGAQKDVLRSVAIEQASDEETYKQQIDFNEKLCAMVDEQLAVLKPKPPK